MHHNATKSAHTPNYNKDIQRRCAVHYEIYIDRLFFLNLVIHFLLLQLANRLGGYGRSFRQLFWPAAGGACFFCLAVVLPGMPVIVKTAVLSAGALVMLRLAFPVRTLQGFLLAAAGYHGAAFGLAGGIRFFSRITGMETVRMWLLIPMSIVLFLGAVQMICAERKKRNNVYVNVWIVGGGGRREVTALVDSGCQLSDPVSGKPVSVVESRIAEEILPLERPECFRLIPYHAIGTEHGLMQAVEAERIYIQREGQEIMVEKPVIAVCRQKLSAGGGYQMILHPLLLKAEKNSPESRAEERKIG